ncbi:MAG TPA: OsmC family protein [Caulobacteraceae bacterium]
MSSHRVALAWSLGDGDFLARRYDRAHELRFEGGLTVAGSASPQIVPAPFSRSAAIDPEAAFTAALSACHMLWFLDHAVRAGLVVTAYRDAAEGTLGRNSSGKLAMTRVVLRPAATFGGASPPARGEIEQLHHLAHESCFIANSVTTEVVVEMA